MSLTANKIVLLLPRLCEKNGNWRVPCASTRRKGESRCQGMQNYEISKNGNNFSVVIRIGCVMYIH